MPEPQSTQEREAVPAKRSRIAALIHLLGDESESVHTAAWNHLAEIGEPALVSLHAAARDSDDALVRRRATAFLEEWERRGVLQSWAEFCARGALDLERGAVLISQSEYPGELEAAVPNRLDDYAHVLRRRLLSARTVDGAVRKVVEFLARELGFSGHRSAFTDPDGSYVHRVLERKIGLPILISTVYLLVARRLGLGLRGVGLPSRFILKYEAHGREVFVDPADGGRHLTRAECRRFIECQGIGFEESCLREVMDREILSRMLGNLLRIYHASGDRRRLTRIIGMLQALDGS